MLSKYSEALISRQRAWESKARVANLIRKFYKSKRVIRTSAVMRSAMLRQTKPLRREARTQVASRLRLKTQSSSLSISQSWDESL